MSTENPTRPRRSWLFRIVVVFAVLVVAALFWPPRLWPVFEPPAPGWEWVYHFAFGPVIPVHIDVDGKRITPTVFKTEPNFFDSVEAELVRRGGRPFLHRHATDNKGRAQLTRMEAAMLSGWLPAGDSWTLPKDIDPFTEGPVPFPADSEIVFFNRDGSVAFAIEMEEGASGPLVYRGGFHEGLAPVPTRAAESVTMYAVFVMDSANDSWGPAMEPTNFGFVTTAGEWAIPPQFDDARPFHEGLAAVSQGGEWGYIDANGDFAIEPRWEDARSFSEGLAAVLEEGAGWGYINPEGEWVIEPQFQSAGTFSDGLAAVSTRASDGERRYGYINPQGEWVIEPQFSVADAFNSGRAHVSRRPDGAIFGGSHYIDPAGEVVLPGPYVYGMAFSQGEAMVGKRVTPARWLLALTRYRLLNRPQWEL